MNWDDLRYFLALSRCGTLKAVGKELKVDQATVGRRIAALEGQLRVQLFEKRSDGFFLTAAGARILKSVESAEDSILAVERQIVGEDERVEGVVRIAMPGALANQWVLHEIGDLLERHPALELEFLTGAEVLNLARRETDIAVRLVRPSHQDLLTRKIGVLQLGLYASKSLKKANTVKADFSAVPFVGLLERATSALERSFLKSLDFSPDIRIRSAAWSSVYAAVRSGVGIGVLPTFIGSRDPSLRALRMDSAIAPLWLVVHPEVAPSARIRTVIQFLTETLKVKV